MPQAQRFDLAPFEKVPHPAKVLADQWSAGTASDVRQAMRSRENYGRLVDTGNPQAISLADAIALAVEHNTNLQVQRLGPLAAAEQVRRARGAFDAVLFGDVTRDRIQTPAVSPLTSSASAAAQHELQSVFTQDFNWDVGATKGLISGGQVSLAWTNNRLVANPSIVNLLVPQYTTTVGLSLNQPLLRNFGWRYSLLMVEVAQNTERAGYFAYEAALAQLIDQVERTYWTLVQAIENVAVQEQGLELSNEVLRQNQGKFNVGALPKTSVLEAQADVARRQANLIQARNRRDVTRDNLRALINAPDQAGALLLVEPLDQPTVVPFVIDLQRSLDTALEHRPELAEARLNVETQGLQRRIAQNQLLPKLDFSGNIGVNGIGGTAQTVPFVLGAGPTGQPNVQNIPGPAGLNGGYGRSLELMTDGRFYNYSAGAHVEIPLGNSVAKADYATAKIQLDQARLSLQSLQENVTLEIKQAVSNLQSDLKSIDATRIARELAEENVHNQQARYNVGLATTKDLLDYQNQLTQARAAEVQALTTYNIDLAEMHRVEGTLLPARNVVIERATPGAVPWWEKF